MESNFCVSSSDVGNQLKLSADATSASDVNVDSTISPRACAFPALSVDCPAKLAARSIAAAPPSEWPYTKRSAGSGCLRTSHAQPARTSS